MGATVAALLARFWQEILMCIVVVVIMAFAISYGARNKMQGIEIGKAEATAKYEALLKKAEAKAEANKLAGIQQYARQASQREPIEKVEHVKVIEIVEKPVYIERDCIDDDGLSIINAAVVRTQ